MDRQTELAINALWTRGIDQINKRIDDLTDGLDERFKNFESDRRWRISQTIFVLCTLITFIVMFIFDVITRHG